MFDRLREYIKMVGEGVKNPEKVAEGLINATLYAAGSLPEDERQEIERRRAICAACPYMSKNAAQDPALNYKTERTEDHCIMCGCPVVTKTASFASDCGLAVHNARNPEKYIPLKWEKYEKNPDTEKNKPTHGT